MIIYLKCSIFFNSYLWKFVGLPDGQMGNSEVGHMTIGSGRILYQDLVKNNIAIEKILKDNQVLKYS